MSEFVSGGRAQELFSAFFYKSFNVKILCTVELFSLDVIQCTAVEHIHNSDMS